MPVHKSFQEAVIRDIAVWIEDNINERISIDRLSETSGYSKWYLQRLFKKHSGIRIAEYIRYRKLNKATALLHLTNLHIYQIADMLGFDSHQTFHKSFFRFFGVTPAEYRRTGDWPAKIPIPDIQNQFSMSYSPDIKILETFVVCGHAHMVHSDLEQQNPDNDFDRRNIYPALGIEIADHERLILISPPKHADSIQALNVEMFSAYEGNNIVNEERKETRTINGGLYLELTTSIALSQIHDWVVFNYTYTLPKYNLTRREGFDLEYIAAGNNQNPNNKLYNIRYLIPVKI